MLLEADQLALLEHCRSLLAEGFDRLPPVPMEPVSSELRSVLERTALRLRDNFPYHHPFYLGQMLRPPHPVALLAYTLAMTINPNNHAQDGGRATSAMELEAVAELARIFGWETHLGHLCSGGTVANFEALWIAREMAPRPGVAASSQAHYTHERLSRVLGVPFFKIPCDEQGKMWLPEVERLLANRQIGTVVATLGTTGLGTVDPLDQLVELRRKYPFRLHVDAAYGGYFSLASALSPQTASAFQAIHAADSIVIDPHKHGLQPYGCGCVLFQDRSVAAIYQHQSPYTYFTSDELHLGEISLECSRAGASAAALWATQQLFPPVPAGDFACDLDRCRQAAMALADWIRGQPGLQLVVNPELDIVVWVMRAPAGTKSSRLARRFFEQAAAQQLHLALLTLPREAVAHLGAIDDWDTDSIVCLRACLIKPEHLEWMPVITEHLQTILDDLASA